jgi:hypothetical protein
MVPCCRLWAWNGLTLNTCISMYAKMNRCYNKRGSRTNYVSSSIPHCSYYFIHTVQRRNDHNLGRAISWKTEKKMGSGQWKWLKSITLPLVPTACEQDQDKTVLILLAGCQQTCTTYTIAMCTVKYSWWWTEELSKTLEFYSKNKFEKLVHLVGFIIRRRNFRASYGKVGISYTS